MVLPGAHGPWVPGSVASLPDLGLGLWAGERSGTIAPARQR